MFADSPEPPPPPPNAPAPVATAAVAAPGPAVMPSQPTNGKAIAAMVLGIVGIVLVPVVCSILGIIFGILAKREIEQTGQGGASMATTGLITGIVGLVLWGLIVVLWIVVAGALISSTHTSGFNSLVAPLPFFA